MRRWLLAWSLIALVGCVPHAFEDTMPGRFEGDLRLRWVAPDLFAYEPDPQRPFRFIRPSGEVIEPGRLVTDGGSIPSVVWGIDGLSPWGFAPAYVVHDWLFQRQRCGLGSADEAGFAESVTVMAEALRTLIGDHPDPEALERYRAIVSSSASVFARRHWRTSPCRELVEPW
jgi:hypothetical protein